MACTRYLRLADSQTAARSARERPGGLASNNTQARVDFDGPRSW